MPNRLHSFILSSTRLLGILNAMTIMQIAKTDKMGMNGYTLSIDSSVNRASDAQVLRWRFHWISAR